MAWSRVTVTGNLSRLSSICVPLLVMAQRALRGLPASQAPTCGLAACAHLARHTYLPHQESPLSFSHFSNPCPDAAGSPRSEGRGFSPCIQEGCGVPKGPRTELGQSKGEASAWRKSPGGCSREWAERRPRQAGQSRQVAWAARGARGAKERPAGQLAWGRRGPGGSSRFPSSLACALPCCSPLYPGLASPALGVASPSLLPNEVAPFIQLLQLLHVCALAQSVITCDLWAWLAASLLPSWYVVHKTVGDLPTMWVLSASASRSRL